ncbi:MAG: prolyl oligopeptidase family serine peptidase, partial [Chloroflexia bacterium]
ISNLSGHYSLYRMNYGGSVPEPLLPSDMALFNPKLGQSMPFYVFPKLGKVLVMIDKDGDEAFQPMLVPLEGGFPEPVNQKIFETHQAFLASCDADANLAYISYAAKTESIFRSYIVNLETGELSSLGESTYGNLPVAVNHSNTQAVVLDFFGSGDSIVYLRTIGEDERKLLYGKPVADRTPGEKVEPNSISEMHFTPDDKGVIFTNSIFEDSYSLGYMDVRNPGNVLPVTTTGIKHTGVGELAHLGHLKDDRYTLEYNIDGCSWLYEGTFDRDALTMTLDNIVVGQGELSGGIMQAGSYDKASDRYAVSYATANSPTQLFTVEGADRTHIVRHTNERVLGIKPEWLSAGEDASYTSFDGIRISARLYMPADDLGFSGPRPVVYYIHGGPQGQERPDFGWFSMPIIQFLTMNGIAVFVPNVRGSTGYGLHYTKLVERDWGGDDVKDHMHSLDLLAKDNRLDATRAGVMGRSYGGYMTLMLSSRFPDRWAAAVDMFGPYNLITNMERMPATWRPFFAALVGDPETEADFLMERS